MKKNYEKPFIKEIIYSEDVLNTSNGSYGNGDDWQDDNQSLPIG